MAVITNLIQDIVEINAYKLSKTNRSVDSGDLIQEGLLAMIKDNVKVNQCKSYYSRIARNAMLGYLKKEKTKGITTYSHGGDRKSSKFKDQKDLSNNINFVSLDGLNVDISEEPLLWGKKTIVPNYDNLDYDKFYSDNDSLTEHWLKGRDV